MAIETISIKDAADATKGVLADKIGAGEDYAQVLKQAYGADGSLTLMDEKPATAAAQATAIATLADLLAALQATLSVGGTVAISNLPATQPVSGTVAVSNFPSGFGVTGVVEIANDSGNAIPVSGTFWQPTQPVSAAALPLPTGAASETTLATLLTTTAFNTRVPVLGQALMAASMPVTIASNQSAIPTVENATVFTGAAAQTATVNNIIESAAGAAGTACENFRAASVQVVSTGTAGTFIFEQSNDNVNWVALPVFNAALVTAVPITAAITATASAIIYSFPIRARFVRLRIATTITGGSIQAFSRFSTEPWTPAAFLVASNTAANLQSTVSGTVTANIGTGSIAAGTNAIGDVGQQYRANATGAASGAHVVSAATTNATVVKASAGRVLGWALGNTSAAWRYVKLHNQTTTPTAGAGVVRTIAIPPGGLAQMKLEGGIAFATGIALTIVTGAADADATAVAANDVVGDLFFA